MENTSLGKDSDLNGVKSNANAAYESTKKAAGKMTEQLSASAGKVGSELTSMAKTASDAASDAMKEAGKMLSQKTSDLKDQTLELSKKFDQTVKKNPMYAVLTAAGVGLLLGLGLMGRTHRRA